MFVRTSSHHVSGTLCQSFVQTPFKDIRSDISHPYEVDIWGMGEDHSDLYVTVRDFAPYFEDVFYG